MVLEIIKVSMIKGSLEFLQSPQTTLDTENYGAWRAQRSSIKRGSVAQTWRREETRTHIHWALECRLAWNGIMSKKVKKKQTALMGF